MQIPCAFGPLRLGVRKVSLINFAEPWVKNGIHHVINGL
jgi:hypothetical protein